MKADVFTEEIYSLNVLLMNGNIVIGDTETQNVVFSLKRFSEGHVRSHISDTIGALCTGKVSHMTSTKEKAQFLEWFNTNINNTEEIQQWLNSLSKVKGYTGNKMR